MKSAIVIDNRPRVQVEFNHNILLAGKSVQTCETYYIEHYGSSYAITWLSVL